MDLAVHPIPTKVAAQLVIDFHYLHRRPPMSFAFGAVQPDGEIVGVVTLGTPPSRHAQMSVSPSDPDLALELNRMWVHDDQPRNTASWMVSKVLRLLPPRIVFSYADSAAGHDGTVYRAMSWNYAGWTDMDRKTARLDYIPSQGGHSRNASRTGVAEKVRRKPKAKYWTTTGSRRERARLRGLCGWPVLDWKQHPPPTAHRQFTA